MAAIHDIEYPATKYCVTYKTATAKIKPTNPLPKVLAWSPVNFTSKKSITVKTTAANAKAQILFIVKPGVKNAVIARITAEVINLKIT